MKADRWYSFEAHGQTEVTLMSLEGRPVRLGARATRFFKQEIEERPDARTIASDGLARMPYVSRRWPHWPKPAGLRGDEEGITLPALMLAVGRSEDEIDRLDRTGGDAA